MSDLATIQRDWDAAARQNAFYNIITIPGLTEQEFWERGEREIEDVLDRVGVVRRMRALDFGCGIGRLTQALGRHFVQVDGVDISSEMIGLAKQHNRHKHCFYHHNATGDLALFAVDTFDLVYSMIVLQHMPSHLAKGYIREFLRVVRPGGYAVFQIPDGPDLQSHGSEWLSMYGTPRADVESWVEGATLLEVEDSGTDGAGYTSYRYTVQK
jgi:2-polyprenyl-3-methyl-5-hydroxy-6-metoxy-1,4-benzoquinol methylase